MKLNSNFITHDTGEEQIMVSSGNAKFSGLVRNNTTAAFIVEELKNEITLEQLINAVYTKYDAPMEIIEKDVKKVIETLRGIGAIEE